MEEASNIRVKVIFIHGNGGGDINAPDGWFPYVKGRLGRLGSLEGLGIKVVSQNFPDPVMARKEYWLPFLEKLGADEKTILVGHSSGAVAAMRYAENHQILGSILVAAAYTDLGMESEKVSGYFKEEWDWGKIKKNQQWIVQFHSIDDPFIPIEEARFIHEKLNTEYFEFTDQEHFGYPTPKLEFPEIVGEITKKLKQFGLK